MDIIDKKLIGRDLHSAFFPNDFVDHQIIAIVNSVRITYPSRISLACA